MTVKKGIKAIVGILILLFITTLLGTASIRSIKQYSMLDKEQSRIYAVSSSISSALEQHYSWREDITIAVLSGSEFNGTYNPDDCSFGEWVSNNKRTIRDESILSLLDQIDEPHRLIHTEAKRIMEMLENGYEDEARKNLMEDILPNADIVISFLDEIREQYDVIYDNQVKVTDDWKIKTQTSIIIMIILISIIFVLLVYVTFF